VIAAEKIALIDDSNNARMPHPLARDSEWEPFVCYTVRMQLVLPLVHPQAGATDTRGRDHILPLQTANVDASVGASDSLNCTKPSGELQDWFVCFRFTDFVRLQQALERNIADRQQQQDAWEHQQQQQQRVTHAFMDEQQEQEYGTAVSTRGSLSCAECHRGEILQGDRQLVMELRALLPPSRFFKIEDAVVLERRTALQAYLDLALQAKPSDVLLDCTPASVGTAVPKVAVSPGDADAQCAGDLVQRWVSIAFARCAFEAATKHHT
jgi:hypothetical protein